MRERARVAETPEKLSELAVQSDAVSSTAVRFAEQSPLEVRDQCGASETGLTLRPPFVWCEERGVAFNVAPDKPFTNTSIEFLDWFRGPSTQKSCRPDSHRVLKG